MIQKWFYPKGSPRAAWPVPPDVLRLKKNEAHLWLASLDMPSVHVEMLRQTLAADESGRAARFRFPGDRDHYIASRGLLRTILGGYLNMKPEKLRFRYGPYGKPELAENAHGETLRFSVSHSRGLALYAIALGHRIGVDIEYICPGPIAEDIIIAGQFFSPLENILLKACPEHARKRFFFTLWTRKEAYLKARGTGLAEDGALRKADRQALWSFTDLRIAPGYAASIAVDGRDIRFRRLDWVNSPPRI